MRAKTNKELAAEMGVNERTFYRLLVRKDPKALRVMRRELTWRHRGSLGHLIESLGSVQPFPDLACEAQDLARKLRKMLADARKHGKRSAGDWMSDDDMDLILHNAFK